MLTHSRAGYAARRPLPLVAACALLFAPALWSADTARRGATETALDRYVAKSDATFSWKKVGEARDGNVTGYTLEMVSQQWLTPAEVNRTEWRHWLTIVKPDDVAHSTALLFITGGSTRAGATPPKPSREFIDIAKATRSITVELRMVPNQPLIFDNDGRERREDDLIAYSWKKFLLTGDDRWPARLPMTKAAVRAMDATSAFLLRDGGGVKAETFIVAGASKRGWTTWTTAAVDRRVVAICPMVIDVLNAEVSMTHHFRAYGFYAPAVGDYVRHGIMDWMNSAESRALYAIEDPYFYRDRLTMPKLLLNACGDQFFLPDSSQFYFDDLPGPKYLRYVPNTDHSLKDSDAVATLTAWHHVNINHAALPQLTWKHSAEGALSVSASMKPKAVVLWQATNPSARDFRLESIGPAWTSAAVEEQNGTYSAAVPKPAKGWTAYMIELTFDVGAPKELKLTTNVAVTPNTYPFAAPEPTRPAGFLSK